MIALLSLAVPVVLGWNVHTAAVPALACILLFWASLAIGVVLSLFRGVKNNSRQNWLELAFCGLLLALVSLLYW